MLLEAHQSFVARLDAVAQPYAADARGADLGAGQAQLVRDALGAMSGEAERVIEDLLLDLGLTRLGCGLRGPRFSSTKAATPPTWKAWRTS